jgi:lysyl-tRNA synthetase class 2
LKTGTTLKTLQLRALMLHKIRDFFIKHNVLEVETPILASACVTDSSLEHFHTKYTENQYLYLQTSPELAMKRLLSSYNQPIYQICKAFRNGEQGRLHNPEFSILEWYRPNYNHHDLMYEINEFLQYILNCATAEFFSYTEIFQKYTNIHPFEDSLNKLQNYVQKWGDFNNLDKDTCLQLILTHEIEQNLGKNSPTFIYDYPISQASLARKSTSDPQIAERFEIYINGIELANGFHELTNAHEQRQRFQYENKIRKKLGLEITPIDEKFLTALEHGIPNCAGVAIGLDRLLMLLTNIYDIDEILSFSINRI